MTRLQKVDWGLPKQIISDRDPKFLSMVWKTIFKQLGVKLLYSIAYHPQTDGTSERINQIVEIAMRFWIATLSSPKDWPLTIPAIQSSLNNAVSQTTQKTPNEVVYGL